MYNAEQWSCRGNVALRTTIAKLKRATKKAKNAAKKRKIQIQQLHVEKERLLTENARLTRTCEAISAMGGVVKELHPWLQGADPARQLSGQSTSPTPCRALSLNAITDITLKDTSQGCSK
jgi:hypothetical protein